MQKRVMSSSRQEGGDWAPEGRGPELGLETQKGRRLCWTQAEGYAVLCWLLLFSLGNEKQGHPLKERRERDKV